MYDFVSAPFRRASYLFGSNIISFHARARVDGYTAPQRVAVSPTRRNGIDDAQPPQLIRLQDGLAGCRYLIAYMSC
jgi:hypothetical protein